MGTKFHTNDCWSIRIVFVQNKGWHNDLTYRNLLSERKDVITSIKALTFAHNPPDTLLIIFQITFFYPHFYNLTVWSIYLNVRITILVNYSQLYTWIILTVQTWIILIVNNIELAMTIKNGKVQHKNLQYVTWMSRV